MRALEICLIRDRNSTTLNGCAISLEKQQWVTQKH